MGENLINWSEKNLNRGYFKMEDVHHGSELFLGFLPRYIDLFPENLKAKELIINVSKFIETGIKKQKIGITILKKTLTAGILVAMV